MRCLGVKNPGLSGSMYTNDTLDMYEDSHHVGTQPGESCTRITGLWLREQGSMLRF